MRLLFLALAVCLSQSAFSWNVTESLREKCVKPTPKWMQDRIEKDLQPFVDGGVDRDTIENTLTLIAEQRGGRETELVVLHIADGVIDYTTPFALSHVALQRLSSVIDALYLLQELTPLPNVDLIISLADRYDRPYFSKFTKAPVFTVSKEPSFTKSVLFPRGLWESDREALLYAVAEASQSISWEQRDKKAFWRGSSSEVYDILFWDMGMRPRLVYMSRKNSDLIDAAFIDNSYVDTFDPCWKDWIRKEGFITTYVRPQDQLNYRYLIAIAGGAAPVSLSWQLLSGSTVCKADGGAIEWYYDALEPNVHYLPFKRLSTDLVEKVGFLKDNDKWAHQMSENAKLLARDILTDESLFLYTYKLLMSYAALYKG